MFLQQQHQENNPNDDNQLTDDAWNLLPYVLSTSNTCTITTTTGSDFVQMIVHDLKLYIL
jgi:hypothetical protein